MLTIAVQPGALGAAIAALPDDGTPIRLLLAPGVYEEKVELHRSYTVLEGAGIDQTILSWNDAAFTMLEDGMKRGTFRSYTLFVDAANVTLRNLTIRNTAAYPREEQGQCVALYADGDHFMCEDCALLSHQDTLFTAPLPPKEVEKNGFIGPKQYAARIPQRHTYRRCRIQGDVDFIFGGAAAWFEDCDIVYDNGSSDRSAQASGYCTAASTPEGQAYGYVFNRCRFTSTGNEKRCIALGRPWREYAQTVLLHCELGPHISAEGWQDWGKPAFHQLGLYAEYECSGPGAEGERPEWARRLTAAEAARYTYERFMTSMD